MNNLEQPKKKNLKLNIIFNALYQVLVLIIPFITSPYISRTLLPEGVGSYSYAYSIILYFTTFAGYGFLEYGTVMIAKYRDDKEKYSKLFWEILTCKVLLGAVVLLVYVGLIFGNAFRSDGFPLNTQLVFLIMGMDILSVLFDITFMFQGLEKFVSLCVRNLVVKVLNLVLIFAFVHGPEDYLNYVIVISVGLLLSGFSTLFAIPRSVARPHFHRFNLFTHFRDSFVYFIPTIAGTLLYVIPKTVLGFLITDSAASGYYESADKLINIVLVLVSSLNTIMMSRMTYLYAVKNEAEIKRKMNQIFNLYFVIVLPSFFGLIAINRFFTPGFFGADFEACIPIVYILAGKLITQPVYLNLASAYYVPSGKVWTRSFILLGSMALSVGLSFFLTYQFSYTGAAIASLITDVVTMLVFLIIYKKHTGRNQDKKLTDSALKSFDAALIMAIIVYAAGKFLFGKIPSSSKGLILLSVLLILIGGLVYFFLLLLFKEEMVTFFYHHYLDKFKQKCHRK